MLSGCWAFEVAQLSMLHGFAFFCMQFIALLLMRLRGGVDVSLKHVCRVIVNCLRDSRENSR